jgi:hypothetical protein
VKFLKQGLTAERATALVEELGFVGIVDLVRVCAEAIDGSLDCTGPRFSIRIKARPKPKRIPARPRRSEPKP